jgi:uridylate kinase
MSDRRPQYRRILLKLSGEVLMGDRSFGIEPSVLQGVASEILSIHTLGVQVGIVIGGGNVFRGLHSEVYGVGRVAADHMGMLATLINALALGEVLGRMGPEIRVMSAIDMNKIAEPYVRERAVRHLSKNRIVLFGGGTGNPYFTTDTAAALRAVETDAQVLLKGTKVDGVYDADPELEPTARYFPALTYQEILRRDLKVMDHTAVSLAMAQRLPIVVFNLRRKGQIVKAVCGERVGTLVAGEDS